MAGEGESIDPLHGPRDGPTLSWVGRAHPAEALRPPADRGLLDDQPAERRRAGASGERGLEGDHSIGQQDVVPHPEQKLVCQVLQPVHDGRSGDQQRRPADQPRRDVLVPARARIAEVVALVDDDQPVGAGRQPASTGCFSRFPSNAVPARARSTRCACSASKV